MPRLSMWDNNRGGKSNDYNFLDRTISEFFGVSGPAIYIWKYLGPQIDTTFADDNDLFGLQPYTPAGTATGSSTPNVTTIEDPLLLENRNRTYDTNRYELRGLFTKNDVGFDLRQFASFIDADNMYIEFHLNDMISQLGRKLLAGDVIELPSERDQFLLNGGPAINKFYVIQNASWASDGWSPTWYPHIWRVQCIPMPATQEYSDILNSPAYNPLGQPQTLPGTGAPGTPATIGDLGSTLATELGLNLAVWDAAVLQVPERYFETQQFWIIPGTETGGENPWIFAGDGIPPNGATLSGQGISFPSSPTAGQYFLRTDFTPPTLFQYDGSGWLFQEADWRQPWNVAHRLLESFINDTTTTTNDDYTTAPERTALSQAVTIKADF